MVVKPEATGYPCKKKWIAPDLFKRILEQLAELGFSGRFSFHLYNEPLLHKGLEKLVQAVVKQLPRAKPVLFTNGTGLTNRRYDSLLKAGIKEFVVTLHKGTDQHPSRPHQTLLSVAQLNLTNRGGLLNSMNTPLKRSCYAPMEMLIITWKGEVLQCFEDARKRRVMGNLYENNLSEIWFSETFLRTREALITGRRDLFPDLCALCNNRDYPVPGLTEGVICNP